MDQPKWLEFLKTFNPHRLKHAIRRRTLDSQATNIRSLMHYAVQDYDHAKDRRHMQRTTISGGKPI